MKKLELVENGNLVLKNCRKPSLKKDHSVIKLGHVGACSSDIARGFDSGAYFYPLVMGHEAMGYVEKSDSPNLNKGDKVVIFPLIPCFKCGNCLLKIYQTCENYSYYGSRRDGAYQEYLLVKNWNLLKLPKNINDADAALIEPMAVMIHVKNIINQIFVNDKKFKNSNGAIIGGGFLSLILSDILVNHGVKAPDVFDRNDYKIDFAQSHGINSIKSDLIEDKKNHAKYDWVVEASGAPISFKNSIDLVKPHGHILWMSNVSGDVSLPAKSISMILRKEITIMGSWNSSYHPKGKSDWKEAVSLIQSGISPSKFVTNFVSIEELSGVLKRFSLHKKREKNFDSIKAMLKF